MIYTLICWILALSFSSGDTFLGTIEVFHKTMPPSLETLDRTIELLEQYAGLYNIQYYNITDPSTAELVELYSLPGTHFPFAVVINGRYSALIDGVKIDFVHFPQFMHGIGRHEGNWSMELLELVLTDTSLLIDENVLTPLDEEEDTICPGEEQEALVDSILDDALSYLGTPYVWGGTDSNGFDCSGLAWRVFNDNGVPLPRTVSAMETLGIAVDRESLQPGDILIFNDPKHTGIYLGDGDFIHCSSYLDRGVVITPLSHSNYSRRYSSARRILGIAED